MHNHDIVAIRIIPLLFLFASCITPPRAQLDFSSGRMEQLALIEKYFQDSGMGREPSFVPRNIPGVFNAGTAGFDPADSTEILQKALDSGANIVLIPKMSSPWITRPLFIKYPLVLIIEEGAVIEAKQGEYKDPNDALMSIKNTREVRVYGYGAVLRMHKKDYQNPPYRKGEWRHTIQILGSTDVLVAGLRAESSGGDGVYLGRGGSQISNHNVILRDLVLLDHHRQGISVITATDLLVENCIIRGTNGTPPSAGIDFEPNMPDEPVINCRVKNCIISGNSGAGIQGYFVTINKTSQHVDITIENCDVYDQFISVFFTGFSQGGHGSLVFIDSDIRGLRLIPEIPELEVSFRKAGSAQ